MRNIFLGLIAAIVGILFSLIFLLAQMGRWQNADQQAKDAQSVIATISNDLIRD